MISEAEIQTWMENLLHSEKFARALRYGTGPVDQELQSAAKNGASRYGHNRIVHGACRVLQSFIEPHFQSANRNIAEEADVILKPDLLLQDVISGAFVIVEIKRSSGAARQGPTELLAYANGLRKLRPGAQIFFVLISTSWRPLETHALAQLLEGKFPVLPLEYREHETEPTLLVRADLLRSTRARLSEDRLLAYTKAVEVPNELRARAVALAESAVEDLIRRAAHETAGGVVLAWRTSVDQTTIYISVAVHDPWSECDSSRPSDAGILTVASTDDDLDRAFANSSYEYDDDTAFRLLSSIKFTVDDTRYPESEGSWEILQKRLVADRAEVISSGFFGEIADRISSWIQSNRADFDPLVRDWNYFDRRHPLAWLPALDSLFLEDAQESDEPAMRAFRCGKAYGNFELINAGWQCSRRPGHFGRTEAEARFLAAWREMRFLTNEPLRTLTVGVSPKQLFLRQRDWARWNDAVSEAYVYLNKRDNAAGFCFILGYQLELGVTGLRGAAVEQAHELLACGVELPASVIEAGHKLTAWNFQKDTQ